MDVSETAIILERLNQRVALAPTDFGGKPEEQELVKQLHACKEDIPQDGIAMDATARLTIVVDELVAASCT